jgi:hypothetical protein
MPIKRKRKLIVNENEPKKSNGEDVDISSSGITRKIIKTIPGCALCTWCTTMFLDVFLYRSVIKNESLHHDLVLITGGIICLILAINQYRLELKTRRTMTGIIGNAFLIYLNALGYQVGTKEIALRLYSNQAGVSTNDANNDTGKRTQPAQIAGINVLYPFTEQMSWLPDKELSDQVKALEDENFNLKIQISGYQEEMPPVYPDISVDTTKKADTTYKK